MATMESQLLVVVGDGPVAEVLVPMAELLGWRATVASTLEAAETAVRSAQAVVVTSHDPDVDAPALGAAVAARPAYIGAMGSRARQAQRREWLLAHGVSEADLLTVHGPAGLDIGANTPAEIALSILAELTAVLRGASGEGSIRDRGGPIHPDLPQGEALSPPG